jgi:hypothetical protein
VAYATGSTVAFREAPDLHTAAHEAAHVVQQRAGVQLRGGVGEAGDPYERHADDVADAVVAGQPAGALLDQMAGSGASGTAVQRRPDKPVGTHKKTDFGAFWVVPDGTTPADAKRGQKGELIEQTKLAAVEAVWNKIKDGSGSLTITETDDKGGVHAGFQASTLKRIGTLMAKPKGRELITTLTNSGKKCTIRPSSAKIGGGANTNAVGGFGPDKPSMMTGGTKGGGDDAFVNLDPNVGDDDIKVHDAKGNEISDPVYIFLGHELIHATHIQTGEVDMTPVAGYDIKEEQSTIATGALNENDLRDEHGLKKRYGHTGRDSRP